jgi:site-specific recombinase XerC
MARVKPCRSTPAMERSADVAHPAMARHRPGATRPCRSATLRGSGLGVSEMLNLNREQYTGRGFTKVVTKGGHIRDVVPVQAQARAVFDEWLAVSKEKKDRSLPPAAASACPACRCF